MGWIATRPIIAVEYVFVDQSALGRLLLLHICPTTAVSRPMLCYNHPRRNRC